MIELGYTPDNSTCPNRFVEYQDINEYLRYHIIDYDEAIEYEVSRNKSKSRGYSIESFPIWEGVPLDQPFYTVVRVGNRDYMKVVLVG